MSYHATARVPLDPPIRMEISVLEVNVQKLASTKSALPLITRYKTETVIHWDLFRITFQLNDVYLIVEI